MGNKRIIFLSFISSRQESFLKLLSHLNRLDLTGKKVTRNRSVATVAAQSKRYKLRGKTLTSKNGPSKNTPKPFTVTEFRKLY